MTSADEGIFQNNVISLSICHALADLKLYTANEDHPHELRHFVLFMYHLPCPIVLGLQILQDHVSDKSRDLLKNLNILQKQIENRLLVMVPAHLFAYGGDGHQLLFIAFVHEVSEAFLLSEPLGVLTIFGLPEIDGLGVRVPVIITAYELVLMRESVQLPALPEVAPLYPVVHDGHEIDGLLHFVIFYY